MRYSIDIDDDLVPALKRQAVKKLVGKFLRVNPHKNTSKGYRQDREREAIHDLLDPDSENAWTEEQADAEVDKMIGDALSNLLFCWTHLEVKEGARDEQRRASPRVDMIEQCSRAREKLYPDQHGQPGRRFTPKVERKP